MIAVSTAVLCAGAMAATVVRTASARPSRRTVLAGTAAPAAARAHSVGGVEGSSRVDFELVLRLRDESGAKALVQALSTPGSPSYRHYLTAAQWEARFSPTVAQVGQAKQWLSGQGFAVGAVSKDRLTIAASGTAAQVESAFGTSLNDYRLAGRTVRMTPSDLSVPASIAGTVVGAIGIDQAVATPGDVGNPDLAGGSTDTSAPAATAGQFPPAPAAFLPAPPCSAYYGAKSTTLSPSYGMGYPATVPDVVCGYKPGQLRAAYGVSPAATGRGVTVAIIDPYGSATIAADATQYFATNDPGNPFANAHFTQTNATPFDDQTLCDASGWLTEQAVDVEAVHAMAPNANILYYGAQDCANGTLTAEQNVIDNRLANVVTNSWTYAAGDLVDDAATRTAYDDLFMLADATGMTILFSSGDSGDNFTQFGFSAADYPASSPYVTAVGGTTLQIGPTGQRIGELGWNTGRSLLCAANLVGVVPGCISSALNTWLPATPDASSGGYTSYVYTQPFYQVPVVPAALAVRNEAVVGSLPMRVVPDMSLDADPGTGFLIGLHQTLPNGVAQYTPTRYGGTSLASPLLAGIVADADQAPALPVGFINPAVYRLAVTKPSTIDDLLPEPSPEGNFRVDYAGPLGLDLSATATGFATSFRELYYSGLETYCDPTGNCASRPETQSAAPGYDSLTGLGSPGTNFIAALAGR